MLKFSTLLCLSLLLFSVLCLNRASAGWWGSESSDEGTHNHDDAHHHHHEGEEEDPDIINVVTCGSVIKLKHYATSYRLHSHQVSYGSGSGQQSVTAIPNQDDNNSFWVVRGAHGKRRCKQGNPIKNGDIIRLQHLNTKLNLHSHYHASPLSKQQEVSCFGPDGNGDSSDNWKVLVSTQSGLWERGKEVVFQHVDTEHFLHSHPVKYKHPIPGQQEITCFPHKNENTKWETAEGIYFPPRKEKDVGQLEEDKVEVEGEAEKIEEPEPTLDIEEEN